MRDALVKRRDRACFLPRGWLSVVLLLSGSVLGICPLLGQAGYTGYYGVSIEPWATNIPGNMKMDYDARRDRFVVQYDYTRTPPQYGTLDLHTREFRHFATPPEGGFQETLLMVLPNDWGRYQQGTTLVPRAGGGAIYAIDPNGNLSTFVEGLPAGGVGDLYATVRWDSFGIANNDIFYCNAGSGDVVRLDADGNIVWQTTLFDGQRSAAPEPMIVLGENPRWGWFQNKLLVGQNSMSTTVFMIDPATGNYQSFTSPIGGSLESFKIYPFSGTDWALYVSIYGAGIYQITGLTNIPNLQPGDLFVARELLFGGEIWHVYFDGMSRTPRLQKIADFSNGFLEDMVFAPVPEPASGTLLLGLLGIVTVYRRRVST